MTPKENREQAAVQHSGQGWDEHCLPTKPTRTLDEDQVLRKGSITINRGFVWLIITPLGLERENAGS
jgi:hypothetical protein